MKKIELTNKQRSKKENESMKKQTKKNTIERTRVITAQITVIDNLSSEEEAVSKDILADEIKKKLNADDVVVTKVKDFILEK